jgi:hypothetical protein
MPASRQFPSPANFKTMANKHLFYIKTPVKAFCERCGRGDRPFRSNGMCVSCICTVNNKKSIAKKRAGKGIKLDKTAKDQEQYEKRGITEEVQRNRLLDIIGQNAKPGR